MLISANIRRETLLSYLIKVSTIALLFVLLPMVFGSMGSSTTFSNFLCSISCYFVLVVVSAKMILNESKLVRYFVIAYFSMVVLSLVHYLVFVDSQYFQSSGSGSGNFYHEYLTAINGVERIVEFKKTNGIFSIIESNSWELPHAEIWSLISIPFYFLKVQWMNMAPFNIYCSLFFAMNIFYVYRNSYKEGVMKKSVLGWLVYFPLFILGDTFWRDPLGFALCSIGMVTLFLSRNTREKLISLFIACFLSYLQRTVYPVLLIGCFSLYYVLSLKSKSLKVISIILVFLILFILTPMLENSVDEGYTKAYINSSSFIMLPIKIVFGLIGPFPWTGFLVYKTNPEFSFELPQYVLGTFQFGYLLSILALFKKINFRQLDIMTMFGFALMLSGFVTLQMHIGYIAEGLMFTLPWFFEQVGLLYKKYFNVSLAILVFLNILIMATGHLSLGSLLWK